MKQVTGTHFTKKINFTSVYFTTVDEHMQPHHHTVTFSRKLNKKQVMAITHRAHGNALIDHSVQFENFTRSYIMSIEYFTEVATLVK